MKIHNLNKMKINNKTLWMILFKMTMTYQMTIIPGDMMMIQTVVDVKKSPKSKRKNLKRN